MARYACCILLFKEHHTTTIHHHQLTPCYVLAWIMPTAGGIFEVRFGSATISDELPNVSANIFSLFLVLWEKIDLLLSPPSFQDYTRTLDVPVVDSDHHPYTLYTIASIHHTRCMMLYRSLIKFQVIKYGCCWHIHVFERKIRTIAF